jgi:hypothetical protein
MSCRTPHPRSFAADAADVAIVAALCLWSATPTPAETPWKAGLARADITPGEALWMSGYGSRDRPAEGALHELWVKALALEDPSGRRVLLLTLDLVGIDRGTADTICRRIQAGSGLSRRQIAIACSHTHTGPVVGENLQAMYFLGEDQWGAIRRYTAELSERVVEAATRALADLRPSRLAWGCGSVDVAVNRRRNPEAEVPRLRAEGRLQGPVDRDVPVLRVADLDGKLRAAVFGYACHATVLSFYRWSGDYPGFAQAEIERLRPGSTALFWAGCGADQNPLPRRSVELAEDYGRRLAQAVDGVLAGPMRPIEGRLACAYAEIELPFARLPSRSELEAEARAADRYLARRAALLLAAIDRGEPRAPSYPYPVQVWRLGGDVRFVLLGGEVVVDYSLRLKRELGAAGAWVAAYANDVMAYIPSRRVLEEGGYEGGGAMVYYGLPSPWAPEVEERIVTKVKELAGSGVEGREKEF